MNLNKQKKGIAQGCERSIDFVWIKIDMYIE